MPKAKDNNKTKKEKKHFFKDLRAELKKVIWPTPKQLANNTIAVITIVLITAVLVFALDLAFETVNKYVVEGAKAVVQKDEDTNQIDTTNTVETNQVNTNTTNTLDENQNIVNEAVVNSEATGSAQENVVE